MNKKELLELCYQDNNEKKLKYNLLNNINNAGFNKALKSFMYRNVILLNKCDIDDISFFNFLVKNYTLYLYSANKKIDLSLVSEFNKCIINNDYNKAYDMYKNNNLVYEVLCITYMKGLDKPLKEKIDSIDSRKINEVSSKIKLLNNTVLEDKTSENVKVYQKTSNR